VAGGPTRQLLAQLEFATAGVVLQMLHQHTEISGGLKAQVGPAQGVARLLAVGQGA
jgi:hypothetical protein